MVVDESQATRQFDLLIEVDRVLQASCYSAIRTICYGLSGGRLVLEGTVPSYHMKQIAQTLVAEIADEQLIDNQIVVDRVRPRGPRRLHELVLEPAVA